jgi:F0F1-type ATP synthase delta subunit
MSFSAEPSTVFMQKMTDYVRQNIHPQALLQVGLQPNIGAGFMLRTTNKYYDFSLRSVLKTKHDELMHNLRSVQADSTGTESKEEATA